MTFRTYATAIVDLAYLAIFIMAGVAFMWLTDFGPVWVGVLIAIFLYPWGGFIKRVKQTAKRRADE